MKKFKELLFLNSINRVAKKTIYGKYWDILINSKDFDDLVSKMKSIKSEDQINNALVKMGKIYNDVVDDSEIQVITVFDEEYPNKLNMMENNRPLILYVKGNVEALTKSNIAFIGTRKPSDISEKFETEVVKTILDSSDRVIVSGLALGCDKIAHQTTVDENKQTIAVLPSGVNVIKPAKHKKLAQDIIQTGGCLISEYEPDKSAYKSTYVERDAIVAALSDDIFVVECGIESGTMHTVDFASDYNKTIFTYIPEDSSTGSFDGNEYILKNKENSIEVTDINKFLDDLNNYNGKKQSVQSTLM